MVSEPGRTTALHAAWVGGSRPMARAAYSPPMLAIVIALTEATETVKDYDELLGPIAWGLVGAALVYAIVATWIVTTKGNGHH
jgi:hypothetical protein